MCPVFSTMMPGRNVRRSSRKEGQSYISIEIDTSKICRRKSSQGALQQWPILQIHKKARGYGNCPNTVQGTCIISIAITSSRSGHCGKYATHKVLTVWNGSDNPAPVAANSMSHYRRAFTIHPLADTGLDHASATPLYLQRQAQLAAPLTICKILLFDLSRDRDYPARSRRGQ